MSICNLGCTMQKSLPFFREPFCIRNTYIQIGGWYSLKYKYKFWFGWARVHYLFVWLLFSLVRVIIFRWNNFNDKIESTHQDFSKRMEAGNYNVKNFRSKIHGKKLLRGLYTLILSISDMGFNKINFYNICSCIYLVETQLIYLINWSYLSVIKTTPLNG